MGFPKGPQEPMVMNFCDKLRKGAKDVLKEAISNSPLLQDDFKKNVSEALKKDGQRDEVAEVHGMLQVYNKLDKLTVEKDGDLCSCFQMLETEIPDCLEKESVYDEYLKQVKETFEFEAILAGL